MQKIIVLVCMLTAGVFLTGCIDVKADASGMGKGNGTRSNSSPPPASDLRSISDLQRENAQLREGLVKLESDHNGWQQATDRQKDEIKALKQQLDDLKKDRDRYKKDLKRSKD